MEWEYPWHIYYAILLLTVEYNLVKCSSILDLIQDVVTKAPEGLYVFAYKEVLQCGSHGQCFPMKEGQVKCLWETIWLVEDQVSGKQTKQEFNFGVCLELVLMEHVKVIFRDDYELSKSMSLTLGRSNIWVTLNVDLERGSKPVTDARTLDHWLSFTTWASVPSVKKHFLQRRKLETEQQWQPSLQHIFGTFNLCAMRNNFSSSPWPRLYSTMALQWHIDVNLLQNSFSSFVICMLNLFILDSVI